MVVALKRRSSAFSPNACWDLCVTVRISDASHYRTPGHYVLCSVRKTTVLLQVAKLHIVVYSPGNMALAKIRSSLENALKLWKTDKLWNIKTAKLSLMKSLQSLRFVIWVILLSSSKTHQCKFKQSPCQHSDLSITAADIINGFISLHSILLSCSLS